MNLRSCEIISIMVKHLQEINNIPHRLRYFSGKMSFVFYICGAMSIYMHIHIYIHENFTLLDRKVPIWLLESRCTTIISVLFYSIVWFHFKVSEKNKYRIRYGKKKKKEKRIATIRSESRDPNKRIPSKTSSFNPSNILLLIHLHYGKFWLHRCVVFSSTVCTLSVIIFIQAVNPVTLFTDTNETIFVSVLNLVMGTFSIFLGTEVFLLASVAFCQWEVPRCCSCVLSFDVAL